MQVAFRGASGPDGDGFMFEGSKARVVVRSQDNDGASPYVFELWSKEGELAEQLVTDWTDDLALAQSQNIASLYEEAAATARDVRGLAASILQDLKD